MRKRYSIVQAVWYDPRPSSLCTRSAGRQTHRASGASRGSQGTRRRYGRGSQMDSPRYGFSQKRSLALLQTYSARSHVSLRDAAREFVSEGRDE